MRIAFNRICRHPCIPFPTKGFPPQGFKLARLSFLPGARAPRGSGRSPAVVFPSTPPSGPQPCSPQTCSAPPPPSCPLLKPCPPTPEVPPAERGCPIRPSQARHMAPSCLICCQSKLVPSGFGKGAWGPLPKPYRAEDTHPQGILGKCMFWGLGLRSYTYNSCW